MNYRLLPMLLLWLVLAISKISAENERPTAPGIDAPPREAIRRRLTDQLPITQLSDEQKTVLRQHRLLLKEKHLELNEFFKITSPEFAELTEADNPSREDRLKMIKLRQEIVSNSEVAREFVR